MKYSLLGLGLMLFGVFGLVFIVMFQSIVINNESEYYVLKEAMEASMLESVDFVCYRLGDNVGNVEGSTDKACGEHDLKIIEQKFVENFTRRFAASVIGDVNEYQIEFYDIIESPPKASVIIKGKTQEYNISFGDIDSLESFNILNNLSGILELEHD